MGAFLTSSGGAQGPGGQTIKLVTKGGKFKFIDHKPRARSEEDASAGDQFLLSSPTFKGGKRVGRLNAACTFTLGGKNGRGICDGAYSLGDGAIFISVTLRGESVSGAVVGGTGAYVGARGTFKSVDRKNTKGDVSDDTITLLP